VNCQKPAWNRLCVTWWCMTPHRSSMGFRPPINHKLRHSQQFLPVFLFVHYQRAARASRIPLRGPFAPDQLRHDQTGKGRAAECPGIPSAGICRCPGCLPRCARASTAAVARAPSDTWMRERPGVSSPGDDGGGGSRALNESVMASNLARNGPTCVAVTNAKRAISVNITIGTALPFHTSARGKLWLAEMSKGRPPGECRNRRRPFQRGGTGAAAHRAWSRRKTGVRNKSGRNRARYRCGLRSDTKGGRHDRTVALSVWAFGAI